MSVTDPQLCSVAWCDEARGHDGPHRKNLVDTMAVDVASWRPQVCQLWLQGESARVRALVLITGQCETALTWAQSRQLGAAVHAALRRFAT